MVRMRLRADPHWVTAPKVWGKEVMADLASRKWARIVCAPDTHTSDCAPPLRDVVQRCLPEPDGNRRSPTAADDHLMGRHGGGSEKHTNAGDDGDRSSESIVGERQVQAYACIRALPPRPFPWRARVLAGCCLQVSSKGCPFAAGGTGKAGQHARVAEELQRRAQRAHIRQVGKRTPNPEPRLLHVLTDELLVVASRSKSTRCAPLSSQAKARAILGPTQRPLAHQTRTRPTLFARHALLP